MARSTGRAMGAVALSALLAVGLVGCGGSGEDPGQAALEDELAGQLRSGGLDNEAILADPETVIEGLTEIGNFLNSIKARLGSDAALEDNDAMVPIWEDIEGRIKSVDPAAHAAFEAQFVALNSAAEAKDVDRTRTAADALLKLSVDYLAGVRLSTPSPTPSPDPSSTAIPTDSPTASPSASSTAFSSSPSPSSTPSATATGAP